MIASGISDIPNVKSIRDDVIIYGVNVQENDKAKNYTSQKQMPVLHALNLFLWNSVHKECSLTMLRSKQSNKLPR